MAAALPLADAQARLLDLAQPLPPEEVAAEAALGRYLAAPLLARRTQPAADLSAMDGYALNCADLAGPWRMAGESAAGHPFAGIIQSGEAVRISTGALVPTGADTILLQEDARREDTTLHLAGEPPRPGRHIRRAGFDFTDGAALLPSGTAVTPAVLALALSAGHARLGVHRRPTMAIIDSGDELATDPENCATHQVPASNGAMLAAMAAGLAADVLRLGPVPDDRAALVAALDRADDADLIITSGGASVGDHDLVRPALEEWGADIAFWKVAIKPGKPIMVARRGAQLILGLPGNPVSSYVTAFLFMLPLLRAMAGAGQCLPTTGRARLTADLPETGGRMEFLRARWNGTGITPLGEQDSSALRALATSNALIIRPAGALRATAGTVVAFHLLENGGIA